MTPMTRDGRNARNLSVNRIHIPDYLHVLIEEALAVGKACSFEHYPQSC